MSRPEWRDQEIFHLEIVLMICRDWSSPNHRHHAIYSIEEIIKHLLPEHLYHLNVIAQYQAHVMYFALSHWCIKVSTSDRTFYTLRSNFSASEPIEWWSLHYSSD